MPARSLTFASPIKKRPAAAGRFFSVIIFSMTLDTITIEEIVNRIRRVVEADRIILFGSAATGDMNRDSDIDLLVIMPSCIDRRKHAIEIRKALRGLRLAFDVIVMETDRFEETKNVIGGISFPANKYGTVIYENSR